MPSPSSPVPVAKRNVDVWTRMLSMTDTNDSKYVIGSPNMRQIPYASIGIVQVVLRSDFRYGMVDPIQWPQMFSKEFDYLCAVMRPTPAGTRHSPLWWTPTAEDFEVAEGSVFSCLGLLKDASLKPLSDLVDELSDSIAAIGSVLDPRLSPLELGMRQARDRLKYFPCTLRDVSLQVRETQRYWLMSRACMDFQQEHVRAFKGCPRGVNPGLMGAFTTEPSVMEDLFNAGIPVWFVRPNVCSYPSTSLGMMVTPTMPLDICTDKGPEDGYVLYRGLCGADHINHTVRFGHTYMDLSRVPLLVIDQDGGYPTRRSKKDYKGILIGGSPVNGRTTTSVSYPVPRSHGRTMRMKMTHAREHKPSYCLPHATQVRGVNKFDSFEHEWMPAELPAWAAAFRTVDLSQPARPNSEIWGYWIPEPALLLRPQTFDRRVRYILTWLRLRSGWLYLLRCADLPVTSVPTQWWRDVLYGPTGRVDVNPLNLGAQRREAIKSVFGKVFEETQVDYGPTDIIRWFEHRVRTDHVDRWLFLLVVWEMFDLGFRYELLALDRLCVPYREDPDREKKREAVLCGVFPGSQLYSLPTLPTERVGLYADIPHRRVPYLEALRRVVSRWPSCPASVHHAPPFATTMTSEEIVRQEQLLVRYYVDTFFALSGRAPIVPHAMPSMLC